jgi:hypothetical protein
VQLGAVRSRSGHRRDGRCPLPQSFNNRLRRRRRCCRLPLLPSDISLFSIGVFLGVAVARGERRMEATREVERRGTEVVSVGGIRLWHRAIGRREP